VLDHEFPELLGARDILLQSLLLELRDELGSRRDAHVGGDEDLLDPLPELLVPRVPKLRHRRVQLPDERLPAPPQALSQAPKPPSFGVLLRYRFVRFWRHDHGLVDRH
jgi:hypothetical protein